MTELGKFIRVNSCESPEELRQCILDFADANGDIQGRNKNFNATQMAKGLDYYMRGEVFPNVLTREFGIRQQAMYIKYYMEKREMEMNVEIRPYSIKGISNR